MQIAYAIPNLSFADIRLRNSQRSPLSSYETFNSRGTIFSPEPTSGETQWFSLDTLLKIAGNKIAEK